MFTRTAVTLVLVPLAACTAIAQDSPKPPDRPAAKTILKQEVDGLVRALRYSAQPDGSLGNGTCRQTAMVLTAAGHCHRYYHGGDGPWIRKALATLIVHRRGNGAFADGASDDAVVTTTWVLAALNVMDPRAWAAEIEAGETFLRRSGAEFSDPLVAMSDKRRAEARATSNAHEALEGMGRKAMAELPRPGAGAPDPAVAVRALVELVSCQAAARGPAPAKAKADATESWLPVQQRGFAFLLTQQENGVFAVEFGGSKYPDVGLTGIGLAALQTKPESLRSEEEKALIEQGLAWLLSQQGEDGSFGQSNVNYSSCSAVMALAASGDRRYAESLARAQKYILAIQNVEGREFAPSDRDYGSIGYGGDERGDLSNLQFAIEALRNTGLDENHEAFAKAVVFLQRSQNLRRYNDFKGRTREGGEWHDVAPGGDGGSAYYPGNSPAGYLELPDGTRIPRSYGSMTYALLKAYTLCGLPAKDPRVQAAVGWIQKNWTVDVNPGADPKLGTKASYQGLYYYYMAMAQALDTTGIDKIEVTGEADVDWRTELAEHLSKLQRKDGSWLNTQNSRWWENQPLVCTVYSMLALQRCGRSRR